MQGLMMNDPLLVTGILKHALRNHADQEIVTRLVEGSIHRYTYAEFGRRVAKLAHALTRMGVKPGDRVGVMGWNTHRQLELYYAVAGLGAVCHTINPKLGPQNAGFVMGHGGDRFVFFDMTFAPLVLGIAPYLPMVEGVVAMTTAEEAAKLPGEVPDYETLIAGEDDVFDWPSFDENTACALCYTSGTTGQPKGVLYSHRALVLHTFASLLPTSIGAAADDVILPVVPMFHVNAWGIPYSALLVGMKLVLPGPGMDGASLHELIAKERVTYAVGVPTVWLNLLAYVNENGLDFGALKYTLVGGAALSRKIIEGYEAYGVRTRQGWGMTEMSPIGTTNYEEEGFHDLPTEERMKRQLRQGKALPFVDMRVVDEAGSPLPWDGETDGNLHVRGPWVVERYYREDETATTEDGWFDTGDVAVIHPDGRMQITDRAKDVIKSGGEWISTIEIEDVALRHPSVCQAAAIGMPHPKWQERPLLIVQAAPGAEMDTAAVKAFVNEKLPRISRVDDVQVVDEIPLGATGKVLKTELRKRFEGYVLPEDEGALDRDAPLESVAGDTKKKGITDLFRRR
ncbi:long-chain-fatty-acid--CoA ligase [Parvularcula dongshanensis]|uniref:Fatty-acyl-CoA synthase n=1 Tax=Parvularcula dongshanensis TaxID=1173995 RepID=A0A840I602_9PROT|nr:long-chain-fatty-acid--CoA ligase [Parvularcula dongshanensis]MBB4659745.1 fatty-acyl-CoA synthase [Parvularcula dongshanensis]